MEELEKKIEEWFDVNIMDYFLNREAFDADLRKSVVINQLLELFKKEREKEMIEIKIWKQRVGRANDALAKGYKNGLNDVLRLLHKLNHTDK